jgi:uncharacterized membrane-anchored protein YitT (DUF2179 family)
MKKSILFITLAVCSFQAIAQRDEDDDQVFKLGIGGSLQVPLGDLKQSTTYGVGFEATGVYNLSESVAAFAQSGINVFKGKDYYGQSNSILHVPILVGARYKFNGFFAGAGIGYSIYTSDGTSLNGFTYSPQFGYDMGHQQFLVNYTSTSVTGGTFSYVGLKFFRTF